MKTLFVLLALILCQWSIAQQTVLLDATTTWNKEEWGIDEVVGKLLGEKIMKSCIVVGVANIAETRYEDYFPQKALKYLPDESLSKNAHFNADNYLRFLVEEVNPH